ncbi:MAG TPA: 16S rRNA (guanine(527)-N(7))-methyltransferase RsmG [Pyrinomonadaceae bacterium]|nr:16S rRNA (guanine(527)-N(7))-methyltransferase RsmG [Pyrinomonadaceae bacterium]
MSLSPREEFIAAIGTHQAAFGLELSAGVVERLADHFDLVTEHNPLLHLTGPATPTEFAIRHVLESLTMLEHLPEGARFADVGSGAGFPALPCLIAREDLRSVLIESKEKKATFLKAAVEKLELKSRVTVVNRQFAELQRPNVTHVTCRALDRFTQHLPRLVKWSGSRTLLFFGGPALREELQRLGLKIEERLMPLSEQRFLFVSRRATALQSLSS